MHRRGARHLASPERLEASARRVSGDEFDARFGTLVPIAEQRLHPLDGGETIDGLRIAYTPGHASHHVCMLDESGWAFTGDVAGVRLDAGVPVFAPTPPPDIDIDQWLESVALVPIGGRLGSAITITASSGTPSPIWPRSPTTCGVTPS